MRLSESKRFTDLLPLNWYTFTVQPEFYKKVDDDRGNFGTVATVRAQAPDVVVVPPLFVEPSSCAAVNAALADGKKAKYSGQCHDGDWDFYTLDARDEGGEAVILSPDPDGAKTAVCGHNATTPTPNSQGRCSGATTANGHT